ncbi:hypothetical protein EVG20_g10151 [Dentipellis fragilis]|uniref:Uncharacterized protein n=1 Tax=Dentipellis fragilis TaxID=205917 RepID=A0A4Y9XVG8_9AGAM|nr:hypothetical protein EVG20_g10151 [Dentipellis fragilis]
MQAGPLLDCDAPHTLRLLTGLSTVSLRFPSGARVRDDSCGFGHGLIPVSVWSRRGRNHEGIGVLSVCPPDERMRRGEKYSLEGLTVALVGLIPALTPQSMVLRTLRHDLRGIRNVIESSTGARPRQHLSTTVAAPEHDRNGTEGQDCSNTEARP